MVAHRWLLDAVANADSNAERRSMLQGGTEHGGDTFGDHSSDGDSDDTSSNNMSSDDHDDEEDFSQIDLANCGPSVEELRAHVNTVAAKSGSSSTQFQHQKLVDEHREFSMAVFKDEAITLDRAFRFLQFHAHREKRNIEVAVNVNDNNADVVSDGVGGGAEPPQKKRKRRKKNEKCQNVETQIQGVGLCESDGPHQK